MYPTEAVLGSPLKVRILRILLRYPAREFTVRELARAVGASHVGVGKALETLIAHGTVQRRRIGRAYAVRAAADSSMVRELGRLFRAEEAAPDRLKAAVRNWCGRRPEVLYAALYGSYARGEAGETSDVDILLVSRDPGSTQDGLAPLRRGIHRLLGRPLSPLVLSPAQAEERRDSELFADLRREGVVLYKRRGWELS